MQAEAQYTKSLCIFALIVDLLEGSLYSPFSDMIWFNLDLIKCFN